MPKFNSKGIIHLPLIFLAVAGLIAFLLISSTAPFKDKLFSTLFPKPASQAAVDLSTTTSYLETLSSLKVFGQANITQTTRNIVGPNKIYHAPGVVVDTSSSPNKVYVADSGNNRFLGFNGVGFCSNNSTQSCTTDADCGGASCTVDGTKPADIVFGQPDFVSGACNRDANAGIFKTPAADSLCILSSTTAPNTAEAGTRLNFDVDDEGSLYVTDLGNNRILKYNSPFNSDKTGGKGDATADFVWGQPNFTSNGRNQGSDFDTPSSPSSSNLWINDCGSGVASNGGISVDSQGNVWIADTCNNRVLRFPKNSNQPDLVLGQSNFTTSGCSANGPLDKMCFPMVAKINPENGELYVLDDINKGFQVRMLVFKPPFTNGIAAYNTIVPKQNGLFKNWNGIYGDYKYYFQSSGFTFNKYKSGEYANGVIWVNDNQANRTLLLDNDGNIIKVIGATDEFQRGGDSQYGGVCGDIYDDNQFYLWETGGSIGMDNANNIYIADNFFHRVSRYSLPYTPVQTGDRICLPKPNGGIFKYRSPNLRGDSKLGESVGAVVYQNQLIIRDEDKRLKVWNNYLTKPKNNPTPDIVIPGQFRDRNILSDAVDDSGKLWFTNEQNRIIIYQLPFKGGDQPLKNFVNLYWADDQTEISNYTGGSMAFDKINKALYLNDGGNARILRVKNYNVLFDADPNNDKLLVDMVIGQPNKQSTACNHGALSPVEDGLCANYVLKFDKLDNLFVVENNYECHGNDRIAIFLKEDLASTTGMFPSLKAKKVLVADNLTNKGPCAYTTTNLPGSPVSIAFNSKNELVVGNDGSYGDKKTRHLKQAWFYSDPLNNPNPNYSIKLPLGAPGEILFDSQDNLVIQDHTWDRVWLVNLNTDPSLLEPVIAPTQPVTTGYISDQEFGVVANGFGPAEKNMSNGEAGSGDGRIITLNGVTYQKGLGVHAKSDIRVNTNAACKSFAADIGVDDEVGDKGSVVFQVWVDGSMLFDSEIMNNSSATKKVLIDLAGKKELKLIVTDGGDGGGWDHADWADAKVDCPPPPSLPGDIVEPFNKVDIFDYNQLLTDFGKTGPGLKGDVNPPDAPDGKVDIFDYNLLLTNFGKLSP